MSIDLIHYEKSLVRHGCTLFSRLCFGDVKVRLSQLTMLPSVVIGEKQYKFEEILPIYEAVSKETDCGTFADFMEAFKTFDREGQGYISAAEMRHVLGTLGMWFINEISS